MKAEFAKPEKKNLLQSKRYYSSVKDKSKLTTTVIKRQLKNNDSLTWPDSQTLGKIRKEVFRQQMELVSLANIYGLYSDKLFKKQEVLFSSLFFRIMAIDKLSKSSGARTPGFDKRDKNLYLKLLESIREKIKHPNIYKASPVKKIWVPKKKVTN